MDIYYNENTGIKTPQDRNLDYFQITVIGTLYATSTNFAEVIFHETLEDAQADKVPQAHRRFEWATLKDNDSSKIGDVLKFENQTSTSLDAVTFKGAKLQ